MHDRCATKSYICLYFYTYHHVDAEKKVCVCGCGCASTARHWTVPIRLDAFRLPRLFESPGCRIRDPAEETPGSSTAPESIVRCSQPVLYCDCHILRTVESQESLGINLRSSGSLFASGKICHLKSVPIRIGHLDRRRLLCE